MEFHKKTFILNANDTPWSILLMMFWIQSRSWTLRIILMLNDLHANEIKWQSMSLIKIQMCEYYRKYFAHVPVIRDFILVVNSQSAEAWNKYQDATWCVQKRVISSIWVSYCEFHLKSLNGFFSSCLISALRLCRQTFYWHTYSRFFVSANVCSLPWKIYARIGITE